MPARLFPIAGLSLLQQEVVRMCLKCVMPHCFSFGILLVMQDDMTAVEHKSGHCLYMYMRIRIDMYLHLYMYSPHKSFALKGSQLFGCVIMSECQVCSSPKMVI